MSNKTRSNEQWQELIKTCRNSGLSDYQWCKVNGIASSTFYKYVKKFRENDGIPQPSFGTCTIPVTQEVVQVDMSTEISTGRKHNALRSLESPAIRLHINGIQVDITNDTDSNLLRKTLQALKDLC